MNLSWTSHHGAGQIDLSPTLDALKTCIMIEQPNLIKCESNSWVAYMVGSYVMACERVWQASLNSTSAQLQLFGGATRAYYDLSEQLGQT